MIVNLFSPRRISQRKINGKTYYIVTFHLSSCVIYAENFTIFSAYTKIYSFYLANSFGKWKFTPEGGIFYIHLFRSGVRETRLSDNMTLARVKNGTVS